LIEHDREKRLKAEEKQKVLKEYIISNPECLELEEALNDAAEYFERRDYDTTIEIAENAIQACKSMTGTRAFIEKLLNLENWPTLTFVLIIGSVVLFIVVFTSYFLIRRKKFK
jgi:hypothetical protein